MKEDDIKQDPHIIVDAYLRRMAPTDGQPLALSCRILPSGLWCGHISDSLMTYYSATGPSLDQVLRRLAVQVDTADHLEFSHVR